MAYPPGVTEGLTMIAEPELITFDDLGKLMQVSVRQLYLMEDDGRLGPARVQIGRSVRFRRREVEQWIAAGCPSRDEWIAVGSRPEKETENVPACTAT